ncbi:MATE family efflux transporter [Elusimicrobiota bacterium]
MPVNLDKIDLTTGSVVKKVFRLSIPIIISNLMHVFYNITDTAWLGQLSREAVAAMAFVFPVLFFVLSIGIGVGVAGSILVAQYEGAGRKKMVNYSAGQAMVFTVFLSLIISALGYFLGGRLVAFLGAEEKVVVLAESYLKTLFPGIIFMFTFFVFSALMRSWGNTKTAMKIIVISNIVNIALDPLLIFGFGIIPAMGMKGAALATVLSRLLASSIAVYILFKGKRFITLTKADLKPDLKMLKKLFKLGWPSTVEHMLRSAGFMILTAIVAGFGTVYIAAYGVGVRIFSVFIMPSLAVGMGVASGVGQNLGAKLTDRAKKLIANAALIVFAALTVVGIGVYVWGEAIIGVFLKTGGYETVRAGVECLRIMVLAGPFVGAAITIRGGFTGAGRTIQSMIIGIIGLWCIRVPLAYFFSVVSRNPVGIWSALVMGGIADMIISVIYYYKGNWAFSVIGGGVSEKTADNILLEEEKSFRT